MTFQPILPIQGYAGWKFLERTIDRQQASFNATPRITRAADEFKENIASVRSASELVNNRDLLEVALGAFDLQDDIDNKYFIQKVLEEGTNSSDALSNRLSDKRYRELSKVFGFGDSAIPNTVLPNFADDIIEKYQRGTFEVAVGNVNDDMRLALNFSESLGEIVATSESQDAQWFAMMGNPPVRRVVETALGLPSSIGSIDIDQQLLAFKDSARANFGSENLSELTDDESVEKMVRLFLLRSEVQSNNSLSSGSVALTLLQQI